MMSDRVLFARLLCHSACGAAAGACVAITLLTLNANALWDIILSTPSPATAAIIFILGCSAYLAFGTGLTAFHFIIMEGELADIDRRSRRPR
jgi:hypothetical protein